MKRFLLGFGLLALLIAADGCMRNHRPRVDQTDPYAAEQNEAKARVEARGRYDVDHNPDDTMSVNTMGSD